MVTGSPTGSWPASHLGLATSPGPEQAPGRAMNAWVPSVKMKPAMQSTSPMLTLTPGCTVAFAAGAQRTVEAVDCAPDRDAVVCPVTAVAGPAAITPAVATAAAAASS